MYIYIYIYIYICMSIVAAVVFGARLYSLKVQSVKPSKGLEDSPAWGYYYYYY